jgi:hypothetical protein
MKFSLWNQNFVYSASVTLKKSEAIEQLAALYRRKKHRKLDVFPQDGKLFVVKGSVLASIFSIGPETWLRHNIQVTAIEIAPMETRFEFAINLKIIGLTVGKNFLIEECKSLVASLIKHELPA